MAIYDDKTGETILDTQVPFVTGGPPRLEKHYMNPIRFRINYRIVPGYALLCVVCLGIGMILMGIDDQKYAPVFIGLLGLICVASMWLLMTVPKNRKKELACELERYDFDVSSVPVQDRYTVVYEGTEVSFGSNGVTVDDTFFWYSRLRPSLVTSNRFNRVWVAIQFGSNPINSMFIPLSPTLIRAVEELDIPLQNREAFDYLLTHKDNAFDQIYARGHFRLFSDD